MTNEEALLRLARNDNDGWALIAVAENNLDVLKAVVGRHFSGQRIRRKAMITLLLNISWHAKERAAGEDAGRWIESFAERWCRWIQGELEIMGVVGRAFPKRAVQEEIVPNRNFAG